MSQQKLSPPNSRRGVVNSARKLGENMNWVECDRCKEWNLFENCNLGAKYDEKKVKDMKFECRMCKMESRQVEVGKLQSVVNDLEVTVQGLEERLIRLERVAEKQHERMSVESAAIEAKIKVMSDETASKVAVNDVSCDERVSKMGKSVDELKDRLKAFEIIVSEEWPKVGDGEEKWNEVKARRSNRKKEESFGERFKHKPIDTVVVIGDSLTGGVGRKLEANSHMYTTKCMRGARIEDVEREVGKLEGKEDRHLVLMVGTNNIKIEGSESIFKKYESLVKCSKTIKNRAVSVVGIPTRYDVDAVQNSRRLGMNSRVKELCSKNDVQYIEFECGRSRLGRDGLHLNSIGQDEVAGMIFTHCKDFLV